MTQQEGVTGPEFPIVHLSSLQGQTLPSSIRNGEPSLIYLKVGSNVLLRHSHSHEPSV